jgi:hypothetical protein
MVHVFLNYGEELWSYGPIRTLSLGGNDGDFETLAENPLLARIEVLAISSNNVLDRGGIALARSEFLNHLKILQVGIYSKRISDAADRELQVRFGGRLKMSRR